MLFNDKLYFYIIKRFFFVILIAAIYFCNCYPYNKPAILVVYYTCEKVPNKNWRDGFVAAINILESKYNITWCNFSKIKQKQVECKNFDIIFIKSAWGTECEVFMRKNIPNYIKKALLISGTTLPQKREDFYFYDVLFYETNWFKQFILYHPHIIHAFGINTEIMKQPSEFIEKKYDYIMVCDFKHKAKRHLKFLSKPGSKLAIGSIGGYGDKIIQHELEQAGIKVLNSVLPEELAKLYYQSRKCYLPCTIAGGGDRSVLEARSCGLEVEIESDNPKLLELLQGPIYDHHYYAQQLDKGIQIMLRQKGRVR